MVVSDRLLCDAGYVSNPWWSYETIYYYDLAEARNRSRQRQNGGQSNNGQANNRQANSQSGNRRSDNRQADNRRSDNGQNANRQQSQSMRTAAGEITSLKKVKMADGKQHQMVKLKTDDGKKVPVHLGTVDQVQRLKLKEGNQLSVKGKTARINDRKVLCAKQASSNGQRISIKQDDDQDLKRVRGTVTNVRKTKFRNKDQQFYVATVETNGDKSQTVILGPAEKLNGMDLEKGDEVKLLVRKGRLNGDEVCIAEQISANDEMVSLNRPPGDRFSSKSNE